MNRWKRKGEYLFTVLFALLCLALPADVYADEISPLAGGPSGDKGRKPGDPGGTTKGDVLGDLWVVVRNVDSDHDGEPIRFKWDWAPACFVDGVFDPGDPPNLTVCYPLSVTANVEGGCVQPITPITYLPEDPYYVPAPLDPPVYDAAGVEINFPYPGYIDSEGQSIAVNLIPLDPECNIPVENWGTQTMEVDSGRLALARTTDYVIDDAYNEAINVINSAEYDEFDLNDDGKLEASPAVSLDAAGRLLLTLHDADDQPYLKTVDSPRENLALYQKLMQAMKEGEGCLKEITVDLGDVAHLGCGRGEDQEDLDLVRAASFLAAAADKSGAIGIDEVIYLNSILGINTVKEDGDNLVVSDYFNFKDDFTYHRDGIYHSGVTARLLQPGEEGEEYPSFFNVVSNVSIRDKVFSCDWPLPDTTSTPVIDFVRAADDALSVIYYIHNYALPEYLLPPQPASSLPFNRN